VTVGTLFSPMTPRWLAVECAAVCLFCPCRWWQGLATRFRVLRGADVADGALVVARIWSCARERGCVAKTHAAKMCFTVGAVVATNVCTVRLENINMSI